MKARVWQDQADLFEVSVLQQTAEPVAWTLDDLITGPTGEPLVLVGRALTSAHLYAIRQLTESVTRLGATMLLCPPFGDSDVGRYLDIPVSLRVVRRGPEAEVRIVDTEIVSAVGAQLTIRSDHCIETALSVGVIATDAAGKPTLLRYQPSNRSGAIFVSTLQLLSYTALSNEQHRQALLSTVLAWRNEMAGALAAEAMTPATSAAPDRETLVPVLLAMAAGRTVDHVRVQALVHTYLGAVLTPEAVQDALTYLAVAGVIVSPLEAGSPAVSTEALHAALDTLGLHAYARELHELIDSAEEARL